MQVRAQHLIVVSGILLLVMSLLLVGRASAESVDLAQSITLAESGYERAYALAFSGDGKYLAVGGMSGVYLYDFQELSKLNYIETNAWVRSLSFLPGTEMLAAGLFDQTIKLWNVPEGQLQQSLTGHTGWVRGISVSGDGSLIASASDDNTLRVWDVELGSSVLVVDQDTKGIRAVAISPDGSLVAGALQDHTVRIWSVSDGKMLYTLKGHGDWVRCLAFSPDGGLLASGSFDKNIVLWNMADGSLAQTLKGHDSSVLSLAFSADGRLLASGSVDQSVRTWSVRDGSPLHVFRGHKDFVYSVAFSPDGMTLASGAGDNTARFWDLEILDQATSDEDTVSIATPSDCRVCHHRRSTFEPAPVVELSCEYCHSGGASLSWCANFPRTGSTGLSMMDTTITSLPSGVPVNSPKIAVEITSPSNGETLYVKGDYLVPETISGKVFYAEPGLLSQVKLQLDILSGEQTSASAVAYPSGDGSFRFDVDINPGSVPAQPVILLCRNCHEKVGSGIALPHGNVHLVVTATTPEGEQAIDERWIRVDSSEQATVPVQVTDDVTGEPISDLMIQATTVLYSWRARTSNAATDVTGIAQLDLESLSQADTDYTISIPEQIVNGISYASDEAVQMILQPGVTSYPVVTLTARAQRGSIHGGITGTDLPTSLAGVTVWAFELPDGPTFKAPLASDQSFTFEALPIDQYLLFADPLALAQAGWRAESESLDMAHTLQADVSLDFEKADALSGKVTTEDGGFLPFAWITKGNSRQAIQINPLSGVYLIHDLPLGAEFLTASAPGYYALSRSIDPGQKSLDFQLVPQPGTQQIPWGDGIVTLPTDTIATLNGLEIELESGWLWGKGGTTAPLKIHVTDLMVTVLDGNFALVYPAGEVPWFYLFEGNAQLLDSNGEPLLDLDSGRMVALVEGATSIVMEEGLIAGLHTKLDETPISQIVEPTLRARLESGLVKAGIKAVQITTLVTYVLSLAVLVGIPLVAFLRKKKN